MSKSHLFQDSVQLFSVTSTANTMAIHYSGKMPERNFTINDFNANGVILTSIHMWRNHKSNKRNLRCVFRSHGFTGIIRTTCYKDSFAIDVVWGHHWGLHPNERCLTTKCKTLREAKSILFVWFREHGFKLHSNAKTVPRVTFQGFQEMVYPFRHLHSLSHKSFRATDCKIFLHWF